MAARVVTVAFQGVEARRVDVEAQFTGGEAKFFLVGMGDKAISESRERVRAAFSGLGLSLPTRRIIVNLAPADLPKEGSHYDLPIALAIMAGMNVIPPDALEGWAAVGELSLDGRITPVAGALPAAVAAGAMGLGLICPEACGPEAAWAGDTRILAAPSLVAIVNHFRGTQLLSPPVGRTDARRRAATGPARGQGSGKRQAGAGDRRGRRPQPGLRGTAGVGQVDDGRAPAGPAAAADPGGGCLETSMIHSVAGPSPRVNSPAPGQGVPRAPPLRQHGRADRRRAEGPAGRGQPGAQRRAVPRRSRPEFSAQALDSLRQPLETGEVIVARANAHVRYPARVQLVAAMNPCWKGNARMPLWSTEAPAVGSAAARRAARADGHRAISGPLMDRIDLQVEVPPVTAADLALPAPAEGTAEAAARIFEARGLAVASVRRMAATAPRR